MTLEIGSETVNDMDTPTALSWLCLLPILVARLKLGSADANLRIKNLYSFLLGSPSDPRVSRGPRGSSACASALTCTITVIANPSVHVALPEV